MRPAAPLCRHKYALWVVMLSMVALGWVMVSPISAQDLPRPRPSFITIEPMAPVPIGSRPSVTVTLENGQGRRLPNKPLRVYVDGERVRQARTDEKGEASIRISKDFPVGKYTLRVLFIGTEDYRWSIDQTDLIIRPVQLEIETIPPTPGIEFQIDGRGFLTGEDGTARTEIDQLGTYPLRVVLPEGLYDSQTRIEFDRWRTSHFEPEREAVIDGDTKLQVGFAMYHPVSFTFAELDGRRVDPARITGVTLKSSTSELHTMESSGEHWLQANRIARRVAGLEVAPIQYGVESVIIDGASVVNQYQQRFFVEPNDVWPVELLLYSARFQSADALFGFSVGDGVDLRYPDGRVEFLPFGADKVVFVDSLARGDYTVQVNGVGGMSPEMPVALSKDQDVTIKVLTSLDITLAVTVGATGALGLLLYGRPSLLFLPANALRYLFSSLRRARGKSDEPISV